MTATVLEIGGRACLVADAEGPVLRDAAGARDLVEEAMNQGASVIVVPVARLDAAFFELRSGLAGDVLQKAVNYGFVFAVLGDVSAYVDASAAFRDLVVEANRGGTVCFAPDMPALGDWLAARQSSTDRG